MEVIERGLRRFHSDEEDGIGIREWSWCWRTSIKGVRCKWFAYGPADVTATPSSCFIKIPNGLTFLVPANPGCPGKEAIKWLSAYQPLFLCHCNVGWVAHGLHRETVENHYVNRFTVLETALSKLLLQVWMTCFNFFHSIEVWRSFFAAQINPELSCHDITVAVAY